MHAYRPSARIALLFLAAAGWTIAGVASWLLVRRIGSPGVVLIGLAILFVSYRVSLDEDNAVPDFASGQNPTYKAQYEREFGRGSSDERYASRARRNALERFLYIARTIGIAMLAFGLGMFLIH